MLKKNNKKEWEILNNNLKDFVRRISYDADISKLNSINARHFLLRYTIKLLMFKKVHRLKKRIALNSESKSNNDANYFSDEKFVIYTAIFGDYDDLHDPVLKPDNCDFVVFTDNVKIVKKLNHWKLSHLPKNFFPNDNLSNSEKNRFIKMHPHKLLHEYKYSIYVDGNFTVISDLTELINKINLHKMAFYSHQRFCVYEELRTIEKIAKASKRSVKKHRKILLELGIEKNIGLAVCSVIVREHNDINIVKIMEEWWSLYFNSPTKRDQVSFPVAVINNNIDISEVLTLGNFYNQTSLLRHKHN